MKNHNKKRNRKASSALSVSLAVGADFSWAMIIIFIAFDLSHNTPVLSSYYTYIFVDYFIRKVYTCNKNSVRSYVCFTRARARRIPRFKNVHTPAVVVHSVNNVYEPRDEGQRTDEDETGGSTSVHDYDDDDTVAAGLINLKTCEHDAASSSTTTRRINTQNRGHVPRVSVVSARAKLDYHHAVSRTSNNGSRTSSPNGQKGVGDALGRNDVFVWKNKSETSALSTIKSFERLFRRKFPLQL